MNWNWVGPQPHLPQIPWNWTTRVQRLIDLLLRKTQAPPQFNSFDPQQPPNANTWQSSSLPFRSISQNNQIAPNGPLNDPNKRKLKGKFKLWKINKFTKIKLATNFRGNLSDSSGQRQAMDGVGDVKGWPKEVRTCREVAGSVNWGIANWGERA